MRENDLRYEGLLATHLIAIWEHAFFTSRVGELDVLTDEMIRRDRNSVTKLP